MCNSSRFQRFNVIYQWDEERVGCEKIKTKSRQLKEI